MPLNQPVQMLSLHDVDGRLQPLRFRYEDERHVLHTVSIQEILSAKEIYYAGIQGLQYLCRADISHRERLFELRYLIKSHRWILSRMIL
ncbi:MAG: hypothetical protein K6B40_05095 [Firmicutes bacterium]|nr:hypothetical protein [Bacillota bacterium]